MPNPRSYLLPDLTQGISQQPTGRRQPQQAIAQINGVSSASDGLRKRQGSIALKKIDEGRLGDAYTYTIRREGREQYIAVINSDKIRVFGLDGTEFLVEAPSGFGYLSQVTDPKAQYRAATIADYTFISNTTRVPRMQADLWPPFRIANPYKALIWVKAANYGQKYEVNIAGTQIVVETAIEPVTVDEQGNITENRISTEEIAELIFQQLQAPGLVKRRYQNVIFMGSTQPFTIGATDARGGSDISVIVDRVQSFTELPAKGPNNWVLAVIGQESNKFDDYYVRSVVTPGTGDGDVGDITWEETCGPGREYIIDPNYMPHVLVRQSSGTFYFGPLNGDTVDGAELPKWGDRVAGGLRTAPDPNFIGAPVNDLFLYKNRLGMLSGTTVTVSRAGAYYDFFPQTVTTVLDDDPLELIAGGSKVAKLQHAVAAQNEVVIFSDLAQYRLWSTDSALTPTTASLTELTDYEVDVICRPIIAGRTLLFVQRDRDWSTIQSYAYDGRGAADAENLTEDVSTYVPSDVIRLAANDASGVWVALSRRSGYRNKLFVYKWQLRRTRDGLTRTQSAWSHWEMAGQGEILDVTAVEEQLYLIVEYPDGSTWMEVVSLADQADSSQAPSPILLDRAVTNDGLSLIANGIYDPGSNSTAFYLPYPIPDGERAEVWTQYGQEDSGLLLGRAFTGNSIVAHGDWSNTRVIAGLPFSFIYVFGQFGIFQANGDRAAMSNTANVQLQRMKLRYHRTQFFEVQVLAERRDTVSKSFDAVRIRNRYSLVGDDPGNAFEEGEGPYMRGIFSVPLYGRADRIYVQIVNDTAKPCRFSSAEWIGSIRRRAISLR